MPKNKKLAIFEGKKIRRVWYEKEEKWYFSVIDIIAILTNQINFQLARNYWKVLKNRLKKEGSEVVTKCNHLKMMASDGKFYLTDAADVETLLRLIQSVPSPNAEPVKLWLAKIGYERIEEINDPEKALNRGREYWQKMGRSEKWIQQRMMGQEIRNKLKVWFRIDHDGARYLHPGKYSNGCMTMIETTRWMEIYNVLIKARKGDSESVGIVKIID